MNAVAALVIALAVTRPTATASSGPFCWERPRGDTHDCICNVDYCDSVELPNHLHPGAFYVYTSTPSGGRFELSFSNFVSAEEAAAHDSQMSVKFDTADTRQEILGFGAALTDATALNVASLSQPVQEAFFDSYFSENGLGYSFVRVPIGGTDFSTRFYTYSDNTKGKLCMSLAREDCYYKIPYLKEILKRRRDAKFLASSWKAPKWMNDQTPTGTDFIKREYYEDWAEYHKRFFDMYGEYDLKFWGATTGNEIVTSALSTNWQTNEHQEWINEYLGPKLSKSGYGDLRLLMMDDQTPYMLQWMNLLFDNTTNRYISGMATHWYIDEKIYFFHNAFHKYFPDKLIVSTEASICRYEPDFDEKTGWYGAELYAQNILQKLNYFANGWIDWNLALDESGGPNYVNNTCEAPVIVNAMKDEFYKRPTFYAMGHFSKFIPPGSRQIDTSVRPRMTQVDAGAFLVKGKPWDVTVVVLNRAQQPTTVKVCMKRIACALIDAPPRSIVSAIAAL